MNPHVLFLNAPVFQESFYIVKNLNLLVVENRHLMLCFNFRFFKLRSSEGFDSHVSLLCFLSICAIGSLIICLDLRFRNKFKKMS